MERQDLYDEFIDYRRLADGRYIGVVPLTYGRARLVIGNHPPMCYDDVW